MIVEDNTRLDLAKELLGIIKAEDNASAMIEPTLSILMTSLLANGEDAPDDAREVVDKFAEKFREEMKVRVGEITEHSAQVWSENFIASETVSMINFYRSPVGQKIVEKTPLLAQAGIEFGHWLGTEIAEKIFKEMEDDGLWGDDRFD